MDIHVILLIFKLFKKCHMCANLGQNYLHFACVVLCMLEYLGPSLSPNSIFLSISLSLHLFASICGYPFRLSGSPADTYVPSFQRQQQHHFLQWEICPGTVLQSTW